MKKVLIATTALVLSGGIAAAEVTLSGDGRMGITYDGDDAAFTSRARVKFGLSGQTDSGLEFGGSFRADQATGAKSGTAGSVYVKGAYGKLSMGDVDGAAEAAVGDLSGVGLTGLGDLNETLYLHGTDLATVSNGEIDDDTGLYALPAALYEYSTGAVTVFVSMGNPVGNSIELEDDEGMVELKDQYGLGIKYDGGTFAVGLGYETLKASVDGESETIDHWIIGGETTMGAATLKANYGDASDIDFKQYGVSVDYAMAATTLTGFVRKVELGDDDVTAYGLGVSHDLGGGASFVAGMVDTDEDDSDAIFDAGVSFKF